MKSILFNDRGISLVLTLILLVVVGLLASALMRSSVQNIDFSQRELEQKQAFYAAEAGIEHLKSMDLKIKDDINDSAENELLYLTMGEYKYELSSEDNIKFDNNTIYLQKNDGDGSNSFRLKSRGVVDTNNGRNASETILIDLKTPSNFDIESPWNLYDYEPPESESNGDGPVDTDTPGNSGQGNSGGNNSENDADGNYDEDRVSGNPDVDINFERKWFDGVDDEGWIDADDLSNADTIESMEEYPENPIQEEILIIENDEEDKLNANEIENSILYFEGDLSFAGFSALNMERSIIIVEGDLTLNGAPNGIVDGAFFVRGDVKLQGERHWDGNIKTEDLNDSYFNLMSEIEGWRVKN